MTSIELQDKKWLLKGNITFKEILPILDQVNQYDWKESIILDLSFTILPFHLLGLKALIGDIDNFFECRLNIGPCTDKL